MDNQQTAAAADIFACLRKSLIDHACKRAADHAAVDLMALAINGGDNFCPLGFFTNNFGL